MVTYTQQDNVDTLNVPDVQYTCDCEEDSSINDNYYCPDCVKIRCKQCVSFEIEGIYYKKNSCIQLHLQIHVHINKTTNMLTYTQSTSSTFSDVQYILTITTMTHTYSVFKYINQHSITLQKNKHNTYIYTYIHT